MVSAVERGYGSAPTIRALARHFDCDEQVLTAEVPRELARKILDVIEANTIPPAPSVFGPPKIEEPRTLSDGEGIPPAPSITDVLK